MSLRNLMLKALVSGALFGGATASSGQAQSWDIPRATVRAVLSLWAQQVGYGVIWSEGVPDFPTIAGSVDGDFAAAANRLVEGSAYGTMNMYCPPAVSFPATAYTLTARVDPAARLVFVYGLATQQECRHM